MDKSERELRSIAGPAHTHYASGWFVEPSGVIWHAGTDHWKPADVALEMYNAASLGPKLPPLLKRVRTPAPH